MKNMKAKILAARAVDMRPVFMLILSAVMSVFLLFAATSCHGDDDWDAMPQDIADFVSQYFPGSGIGSYSHNGDTYHVRIDNGPGITFDSDYAWVSVDGYGMPLPQVLLFDQLPPKLYAYLQDSQQLDSVFSMERDSRRYTLSLLNSTLIYDIATGAINGTTPS